MGDGVVSIEADAFWDCARLAAIAIPDSVTSIGEEAFEFCFALGSVTIGNSVQGIGNGAFSDCASLASVTIPSSVTNIGESAFSSCSSLGAITVEAANPVYSSVDGVLFDKSRTTLIAYPGGKAGAYTVLEGVTGIGASAFNSSTNLTGLTIPNSVTNIGDWVLLGCGSLASVTIGSGVASIGEGAFDSCGSLATIAVPDSVTSIGGYAFASCTNLASVTIGSGVSSIGDLAFYGCSVLQGVHFLGDLPGLGFGVFSGDKDAVLYYLPGTTGWGSTLDGFPTVLWNAQTQTRGGNLGVRGRQFGFTITGASNIVVVVEASANLANPVWSPLSTNTLSAGSFYFTDPQWTNYPSRFYRLRWP
jgi:hypothetical protein